MRRLWPLLSSIPLVVACSSDPTSAGAGGTGGLAAGAGGVNGASNATSGSSAAGTGGSVAAGPATTGSGNPSTTTTTGGNATAATTGGGATTAAATTGSGMTMMMPVPCSSSLPSYNNNGSVTYYTLDMGSQAVNCSYDIQGHNPDVVAHVATGSGHYFGAMNTADYNNAAACGACVEVTRDGNKKVVATIVDQCPVATNPKCKAGHIDLSKEAFLQIGNQGEGYLGTGNGGSTGSISWKYVACPTAEDISFRLKEPTNASWNQILVEAHRYPITKVEVKVNGNWVSAARQSYNYWQAGDGNMGASPYQVRVTDINGYAVEAQIALTSGDQMSKVQFPACL